MGTFRSCPVIVATSTGRPEVVPVLIDLLKESDTDVRNGRVPP